MAVVNGTAGNDLIHVAGDGVVAPPGFIDFPQATAFDDTLNGLGGIDVLDGGDGNDSLVWGSRGGHAARRRRDRHHQL